MSSWAIVTIRGKVVGEIQIYERAYGRATLAKKVYSHGSNPMLVGMDDRLYRIGKYKGNRIVGEESKTAENFLEIVRALGKISAKQFAVLQEKWKERDRKERESSAAYEVMEGLKTLGITPGRELAKALDEADRGERKRRKKKKGRR